MAVISRPSILRTFIPTFVLAAVFATSDVAHAANEAELFENAVSRFNNGDYPGAIIQLKNVLQTEPDNISARVLLGRAHLQSSYGSSAEKELLAALKLGADPKEIYGALGNALLLQRKFDEILARLPVDNPLERPTLEVLLIRARAHFELGQLDKAEIHFRDAERLDPTGVDPSLGRAQVLQARGELASASDIVDAVIARVPRNSEALFRKGELLSSQRKLAEARTYYDRALLANPNHIRARIARARVAFDLGDFESSLSDATQVHQAHPRDPIAAFIRAQSAARTGDFEQAKIALEAAKISVTSLADDELKKDPARLQIAGVIHYLGRDYDRASRYLSDYLRLKPYHHSMRRLHGMIQLELGDPKAAVSSLHPLRSIYREDPELLAALGDALMRLGRYVEASNLLQNAVDIAPEEGRLTMSLAMSHLGSGRDEQALAELQRAANLGVDRGRSGMLLTMVQMRKNKLDEAVISASTLLEKDPQNPATHNLLGAVHLSKGDYDRARELFSAAINLRKDYPPALHNLAKMDLVLGNVDAARRHYEKILERDARDPQALIGMSDIAVQEGDLKRAIGWLSKSTGSVEEGIQAPLRLISLHLKNGNDLDAQHVARRLVENFPEDAQASEALASVQAAMGRTEFAVVTYRRAVTYAGFAGPQLMRLARGQIEIGDFEGARFTLSKAMNSYVGEAASFARTRLEIITKHFDKAAQFAADFGVAYPNSSGESVLRAEILEAQEKYAEAINLLQPVAALEADSSQATVKLFEILFKAERTADAIALLEARASQYPNDKICKRALAMGYLAVQQFEAARVLHEELLEDRKDDAALVANLARIYQLLNLPGARATAQRAVAMKPEWSVSLETLGWILVTEGDVAEGLQYLRKALARDGNALTRYHLAVALNELGRDAEARTELERILRTDPELKWIEDVRTLRAQLDS